MKGDEENLENYRKFLDRVSELINIYDLIKYLYLAGYPEIIKIQIRINNYKSLFIKDDKEEYSDYKEFILKLNSILDDLRRTQLKGYKDKPLLRFIYDRQFNLVINALKGDKKISEFLMFFN